MRKLCVLLNAKVVYMQTAAVLSGGGFSLEFTSTMVQTLNLILLTAKELQGLRDILKRSFKANSAMEDKEGEVLATSDERRRGVVHPVQSEARCPLKCE